MSNILLFKYSIHKLALSSGQMFEILPNQKIFNGMPKSKQVFNNFFLAKTVYSIGRSVTCCTQMQIHIFQYRFTYRYLPNTGQIRSKQSKYFFAFLLFGWVFDGCVTLRCLRRRCLRTTDVCGDLIE